MRLFSEHTRDPNYRPHTDYTKRTRRAARPPAIQAQKSSYAGSPNAILSLPSKAGSQASARRCPGRRGPALKHHSTTKREEEHADEVEVRRTPGTRRKEVKRPVP